MRDSWRHFAAEFIGIFALVFVGGASIMASAMTHNANGLVVAAIAHGVILAIMVTATMRISGHLNPAVTLGFLATRRIEPMMAMVYIVAQLLGAAVAAWALKAVFPAEIATATRLGGQSVAIELSQVAFPGVRRADVNDVLMNTLGAALGFLAYRLAARARA